MEKTTVYLPHGLKLRLRHTALRRGTSEAEVIREVLDRGLAPEPRPRPRAIFDTDDDPTLARRVDEALEGFGE